MASQKAQTRQHVRGENFYTSAKDVKRKKMLSEGHRATRDKDGKILKAAPFQSSEAAPGRIQPDRRWFGNTRVISRKLSRLKPPFLLERENFIRSHRS